MATFKVGVRGINLTILKLIAKVMGAETVQTIMTMLQAVLAIAEGVALFYVVACLTAPIAHLVVIFAPSMYGMVVDSDLSFASSLAFEIRGLVHIMVNAVMDTGDSIGGGKSF